MSRNSAREFKKVIIERKYSYLCLLACSGVRHISCCVVFLLCSSSSCVHYVAIFSGLSIVDCLVGILYSLFEIYIVVHAL